MSLYHKIAVINYRANLISRTRETPAGEYVSYEPVSKHNQDEILNIIEKRSEEHETVYDIGAYSGSYTLSLANNSSRTVVAFEPNPKSRERLLLNLRATDPSGNVVIRPYGLGEKMDKKEFYLSSYPKISSFSKEDSTRWGAKIEKVVEIPIVTLDKETESLPNPDHIKIDAEGYAPSILRGSTELIKTQDPTFYIEPHDRDSLSRSEEIKAWCQKNNYEVDRYNECLVCSPE